MIVLASINERNKADAIQRLLDIFGERADRSKVTEALECANDLQQILTEKGLPTKRTIAITIENHGNGYAAVLRFLLYVGDLDDAVEVEYKLPARKSFFASDTFTSTIEGLVSIRNSLHELW